ncbi:MAG: hypothetical protein IT453_12445 [Planctomycetes bacterium]|nr:hypothetical protein [Planctomycetota bacterium]
MQADRFEALKREHGFEAWRAKSSFPQPLRGFELREGELQGWRLARLDRRATATPPRTTWLFARGPDELLRVDVIESPSVAAAHEELVRTLGEFQAPLLGRQETPVAGDVAFVLAGSDASVLFARGNVLVLVRNGGRKLVDATAAARTVDARLIEELGKLGR